MKELLVKILFVLTASGFFVVLGFCVGGLTNVLRFDAHPHNMLAGLFNGALLGLGVGIVYAAGWLVARKVTGFYLKHSIVLVVLCGLTIVLTYLKVKFYGGW